MAEIINIADRLRRRPDSASAVRAESEGPVRAARPLAIPGLGECEDLSWMFPSSSRQGDGPRAA
jgi:hypothetical protein